VANAAIHHPIAQQVGDLITSAEEFVACRKSADIRQQVRTRSEDAPETVWLEILARYPDMRVEVASNLTVSEAVVRRLANDPEPTVRAAIARRQSLPGDIFESLARDPHWEVREAIALNPTTPPMVRTRLSADREPRVSRSALGILAKHEAASALRGSVPAIPGLTIDQSDPGQVAVVVGDDTSADSFRALLSWLPKSRGLFFFDAAYPSPSDLGAFVTVQRSGDAFAWRMGNHGWSGGWRPVSADEVAERLAANRLGDDGTPARVRIQNVRSTV
jgi:hypothetical protein